MSNQHAVQEGRENEGGGEEWGMVELYASMIPGLLPTGHFNSSLLKQGDLFREGEEGVECSGLP